MTVNFTVYGVAQPAGSKRGFYTGGRVIITDANKNARPWKALVSDAASQVMVANGGTYREKLAGPLHLTVTFYLPRPKGHTGKRGLRPSAPVFPTVKPDLLKLARGAEDAMTGIVYGDDAQIVDEHLRKRYADDGPARTEISVRVLEAAKAAA